MDAMLQFQADLLGVTVSRPIDQETTALGAAFLAGLAEGVFPDLDGVAERWTLDATFQPAGDRAHARRRLRHVAARRRALARLRLPERQPAPEVAAERRHRGGGEADADADETVAAAERHDLA